MWRYHHHTISIITLPRFSPLYHTGVSFHLHAVVKRVKMLVILMLITLVVIQRLINKSRCCNYLFILFSRDRGREYQLGRIQTIRRLVFVIKKEGKLKKTPLVSSGIWSPVCCCLFIYRCCCCCCCCRFWWRHYGMGVVSPQQHVSSRLMKR